MKVFESKKDILYFSLIILIVIIVLILGGILIYSLNQTKSINSFEECAKYYPVQETFPERCITKDGKTFVKQIQLETIELTGNLTCLPHKNTTGAQTLECAQGLFAEGNYYSLDFSKINNTQDSNLILNQRYTIKGKFFAVNNTDEKYDIIGKIEVTKLILSNN